ncbi:MAG: hypothetical protein ACI8UG_002386 [Gammaproteobacteria bacterium]|jgi:hypothetical protein
MNAFIRLTSVLTNPTLAVDKKLKEICNVTSEVVAGADKVSLWTFKDNYSKIVSIVNYQRINNKYGNTVELKREDFGTYFDAIISSEVTRASDAREHPQTACFKDVYFKPNNVYSLLDFILHHNFKPIGIICCESVGKIYQWTEDDVKSLRRIANASSLYFNLDEVP